MSSNTSAAARAKRRRETGSAASLAAAGAQAAASPDARSPRTRRRQEEAEGDGDHPEPESNNAASQVGEEPSGDEGVQAVAARVRCAGKARPLSGKEKRTRFLAKYDGKTPEEILDTIARGWRSKVYGHYLKLTVIRKSTGVMHHFILF
ncbi:hypothetical protein C8Q80DRAFT_1268044 [Daedaleopsis nitida]|nr:hypothetical protein C8Q80DRAFT_1268044 [Daedaleopsis nitida]